MPRGSHPEIQTHWKAIVRPVIFRISHLFVAALVVFSITGCQPSEPQTHAFLKGQYQVTCPGNWSVQSELNAEADFQVGNLYNEAYMIFLSEPVSDFPDEFTLDDFCSLVSQNLVANVVGPEVSETQTGEINGMPTRHFTLSGTVDNIPVVYWVHVIKSNDHYHQVLQWSLKDRFEANRSDFKAAIESFRSTGDTRQMSNSASTSGTGSDAAPDML